MIKQVLLASLLFVTPAGAFNLQDGTLSVVTTSTPEGLNILAFHPGVKSILFTGNNGKKLGSCTTDICGYLWPIASMKVGRTNTLTVITIGPTGVKTETALTRVGG